MKRLGKENGLVKFGVVAFVIALFFCTYGYSAEIVLTVEKSGNDVHLSWTDDGSIAKYDVLRVTDASTISVADSWHSLTDKFITDSAPAENFVFYRVEEASESLVLNWTEEGPLDCNGFPCDEDGFQGDGFSPLRGNNLIDEPYSDGVADLAISGDPAEFRVELTCSHCTDPADISYVDLLLDLDDSGTFDCPDECLAMTEIDPLDLDLSDGKIYSFSFASFNAVDLSGQVRWAKEDGEGILMYSFRASDGTLIADGPATAETPLTLWNNAHELIYDLGTPLVETGACSYDTEWESALTYFEEAEALVEPPQPYNQYLPQEKHPDYLSSVMASAIAETAYTFRNYDTLFQSDPNKAYRDVMTDWINFSNEQLGRMDIIANNAPSAPNPAWKMEFPEFCIFTEQGSAALRVPAIIGSLGMESSALNMAVPPLDFSLNSFANSSSVQGRAVPEPIYSFGDNADSLAEWDRSDAYLLKSLFLSIRAVATGFRVYEDSSLSVVLVSDLDWIETALSAESDALDHAECDTEPCPPLNGLDDDNDGLVDDLGFTARVIEMFPGLGVYSPDGTNTLESISDDTSSIIDSLRQAMVLTLVEDDNQTSTGIAGDPADAVLVYEHNYGIPPAFVDDWSYTDGDGVADGLPDISYVDDNIMPVAWCPEDGVQHSPPMTIQGGLGGDIDYWIDQMIDFYNEYSGETPLDPACYPQEWGYAAIVCDWGYQYERAVLPAGDPNHICFNFRDDIMRVLNEYNIDPADLGSDFLDILDYVECIDIRDFIDNPEDVRDYTAFTCSDLGQLPVFYDDPACGSALDYSFNGFIGDWEEELDPIVSDNFWTIEPFSTFAVDQFGIIDAACDTSDLAGDPDCIENSWNDLNGNGEFDLFEPILMVDNSTPLKWIDLNNDGQWNGWTDIEHLKVDPAYYTGLGLSEPANPGSGLYNTAYVYFKDPTFGGRFPDMTNEDLNNFASALVGVSSFDFDNHSPVVDSPVVSGCTDPLANYCFQVNASDADGDTLHYKLIVPELWTDSAFPYSGNEVVVDGHDTGYFELSVPSGTWGLIILVYDNVNNLNDVRGTYIEVTK